MRKMMKKTGLVFGMCLGALLISYNVQAQTENLKTTPSEQISKDSTQLQLDVEGMSCQAGCANGIDNMLRQQKGILKSKTTYATGTSLIWYDKKIINEKEIMALIEDRGFKVKKKTDQK